MLTKYIILFLPPANVLNVSKILILLKLGMLCPEKGLQRLFIVLYFLLLYNALFKHLIKMLTIYIKI